jgi:hypothetical protein
MAATVEAASAEVSRIRIEVSNTESGTRKRRRT